MEIHTPEGPTHSFRDFAIHIGIVTIGILIALGLEGIRETVHEHSQREETRELFEREIQDNSVKLRKEKAVLKESISSLDSTLKNMPTLAKNPQEIKDRVKAIQPGLYSMSSTSWDTALSTGVLGHMKTNEVNRFANVALSAHAYTDLCNKTLDQWLATEAFFEARENFSSQEITLAKEKLSALRIMLTATEHMTEEIETAIQDAQGKN